MTNNISLIVTTYNRPDALELVLMSIENQTIIPKLVVIADDGSGPETKKVIDSYIKKSALNIIHSWHKDKGFRVSKARNKAITHVSTEIVLLVDGDMILNKFFVEDHLKNSRKGFFLQGSRCLLSKKITQKVLIRKQTKFHFFSQGISNRLNSIRSSYLSKFFLQTKDIFKGIRACNMSFFLSDFIQVNGFNNDIEGWGKEDSEFIARMSNLGIKRNNLKFLGVQYHLWHKNSTRNNLERNETILAQTISSNLTTCAHGFRSIESG